MGLATFAVRPTARPDIIFRTAPANAQEAASVGGLFHFDSFGIGNDMLNWNYLPPIVARYFIAQLGQHPKLR